MNIIYSSQITHHILFQKSSILVYSIVKFLSTVHQIRICIKISVKSSVYMSR